MADFIDLPLEDIIREKIKREEDVIIEAQRKVDKLNNQLKLLSGDSDVTRRDTHAGNMVAINPKNKFNYPSQKEMRDKIIRLLREKNAPIKTSQIIDYYYKDLNNHIRFELIRRYSVTLNSLKKKEQIFSKKEFGEKGFFYTIYKELLEEVG